MCVAMQWYYHGPANNTILPLLLLLLLLCTRHDRLGLLGGPDQSLRPGRAGECACRRLPSIYCNPTYSLWDPWRGGEVKGGGPRAGGAPRGLSRPPTIVLYPLIYTTSACDVSAGENLCLSLSLVLRRLCRSCIRETVTSQLLSFALPDPILHKTLPT